VKPERPFHRIDQFLYIFDDLFKPYVVSAAYDVCMNTFIPPALFYVSIRSLLAKQESPLTPYFGGALSHFIFQYLTTLHEMMSAHFDVLGKGFEFWLGISGKENKNTAYLHVDNDELLRSRGGYLRSPLVGSILYLGCPRACAGGETLFLNPRKRHPSLFRSYESSLLSSIPGAKVVDPSKGRLVLFAGDTPHAMLPITRATNTMPRVVLLANLWPRRILSVQRGVSGLTPRQYLGRTHTLMSRTRPDSL
jgi:hypothetical protein